MASDNFVCVRCLKACGTKEAHDQHLKDAHKVTQASLDARDAYLKSVGLLK